MNEMEREFEELLELANEKSLEQEKIFILCLDGQPEISDSPAPVAASL